MRTGAGRKPLCPAAVLPEPAQHETLSVRQVRIAHTCHWHAAEREHQGLSPLEKVKPSRQARRAPPPLAGGRQMEATLSSLDGDTRRRGGSGARTAAKAAPVRPQARKVGLVAQLSSPDRREGRI